MKKISSERTAAIMMILDKKKKKLIPLSFFGKLNPNQPKPH